MAGSVTDSRTVNPPGSSRNRFEIEPMTVPSPSSIRDRRASAPSPAAERSSSSVATLASHPAMKKEHTLSPSVSTMLTAPLGAVWME